MTHRKDTNGEDLYLIDAKTGKLLLRKFGKSDSLGVELSKEEVADKTSGHSLIAVHNHPTNVMPTGSDYAAAGYRRYKFGIVSCHDGRVFKYSTGEKPFLPYLFDRRVAKYQKPPYNLDVEKAYQKTTTELKKEMGITCEEL